MLNSSVHANIKVKNIPALIGALSRVSRRHATAGIMAHEEGHGAQDLNVRY
jgi:hypothetical protein